MRSRDDNPLLLRAVPDPVPDPDAAGAFPPHHPKSPFPLRTADEAAEICGRKARWFNAQAAARLIPYVDMNLRDNPGRGEGTKFVRMFRNDTLHAFIEDRTVEAI